MSQRGGSVQGQYNKHFVVEAGEKQPPQFKFFGQKKEQENTLFAPSIHHQKISKLRPSLGGKSKHHLVSKLRAFGIEMYIIPVGDKPQTICYIQLVYIGIRGMA